MMLLLLTIIIAINSSPESIERVRKLSGCDVMQVALQCITWTAAILSRWKTYSPNHHNSKSVFSKLLTFSLLVMLTMRSISMILCVTLANSRQDSHSSIVSNTFM